VKGKKREREKRDNSRFSRNPYRSVLKKERTKVLCSRPKKKGREERKKKEKKGTDLP